MTLSLSLASSAFLLGLLGGLHCIGMCSAAVHAVTGTARARHGAFRAEGAFQIGRLAGYAVLGLVAAAAGGALSWGSDAFAVFRPVWAMVNAMLLAFGVILLWTGRQPRVIDAFAHRVWHVLRGAGVATGLPAEAAGGGFDGAGGADGAVRRTIPIRPDGAGGAGVGTAVRDAAAATPAFRHPLVIGALWGLMPCGLLWSAVALAALAPDPAAGALVMASFAAGSGGHLAVAAELRRRLARIGAERHGEGLGARIGGAMLAVAAAAALWSLATGGPNPLCA